MPVNKKRKKKAVVRKRSNPVPERDVVLEYGGWKAGDHAWFPIRSEATPHEGVIKEFHPNDNLCPCASLWDNSGGGYRVIPMDYIFEDKKSAKKSRESYLNFMKEIVEKSRKKEKDKK